MVHISDNLQDRSIIWGVGVQFASKRLIVPEVLPETGPGNHRPTFVAKVLQPPWELATPLRTRVSVVAARWPLGWNKGGHERLA